MAESIIKKRFVEQVLNDEGRRFIRNEGREIRKQLQFHTKRLFNDRKAEVTTGDDMDGKLSITVPHYTRLLDLRKKTKIKGEKRKRSAKGYRIYNRFAYGHFYGIAFRLQHDFTEEVAQGIRRQWQKERCATK